MTQLIRKTRKTVRRMTPDEHDRHLEDVRERLARKVARQKQLDLVEAADETLEKVDENLSILNNHNW